LGRIKQKAKNPHSVNLLWNSLPPSGAYTDVFAPRHLAHVKQRKTAENQVQNYGSKPKVQNLSRLLVFAPRKTPNNFNATPLRWQFPKIQPSRRAKIGKL
jgi:hypothetical protein